MCADCLVAYSPYLFKILLLFHSGLFGQQLRENKLKKFGDHVLWLENFCRV